MQQQFSSGRISSFDGMLAEGVDPFERAQQIVPCRLGIRQQPVRSFGRAVRREVRA
ncbi:MULTISPECIES: hypothetical protein [unclassified Sphingomonas]|uniref:hypothetical protein n=1 Tax=unclassified Sphingomonas TaxID=196159 RepID=UPI00226A58FF|nr:MULTISPECIES: hypothetical protein [unclassified Sphingomonas]